MPVADKHVWQFKSYRPWPLAVLDRDFDRPDWQHDVVERLSRGERAPEPMAEPVPGERFRNEREVSWQAAEETAKNAVRTGAAYLTDRQNAERAEKRALLKQAYDEAVAALRARNEAAEAREAEKARAYAEAHREYLAEQQRRETLRIQAQHDWERETILRCQRWMCQVCGAKAMPTEVDGGYELRCVPCKRSTVVEHAKMIKWLMP